jgi:hypothetical protein
MKLILALLTLEEARLDFHQQSIESNGNIRQERKQGLSTANRQSAQGIVYVAKDGKD